MPQPDISARRAKAAEAWALSNEVILIGAGTPVPIPGGADQCFPYQPHPEYRWLTEGFRPGSVLAFDPQEGWTHFTPAVTEAERVWDGVSVEPDGPYLEDLDPWLANRADRPIAWLGVPNTVAQSNEALLTRSREQLTHARRPKDEFEIDLMRRAAAATLAGHQRAVEVIRPGVTEREVQIEIETAFFKAGATKAGYSSIVGTGTNSAVFHFTPGQRPIAPGDSVLVDAGAEYNGYVTDVTRTYPADGKFGPEQQAIYDVVLNAEKNGVDRCRNGVEWLDLHRDCAADLAAGLIDLGILRGSVESAIETEAIALFLPHGIGHMVGLGVRDASGTDPGRLGNRKSAGVGVRCDMILKPGYVMTVEPGLYFIPAILNDPKRHEKFGDAVNWELAQRWIPYGGMRIEDNVLVTEDAPINLTAEIPK